MELLIGAISLASLFLNLLIYKRITASYVLGTVEELTVETIEPVEQEVKQVIEEEVLPPITVKQVQEVYQGWRNTSGVPWSETAKPATPIPPKSRGPMERPDGFI